jgi:clusterin-associated protein 1
VKLNPKKLYMADGYAVKELLKIANLLHQATKPLKDAPSTVGDLTDQLAMIKFVRSMATNLTEKGADLYHYLGKEENLRVILRSVKF